MVRKARRSLGAMLADAQERGLVAQNVVYSLRKNRRTARTDGNGKLKIGTDIPALDEVRAIVAELPRIPDAGRWRPLLLIAIFTGLRASELRGLRWPDVDFKRGELHVRQRADRYRIGRPKSAAGERTVPLPPMVITALKEHRLTGPGERDLVFLNGCAASSTANIVERGFTPAQVAAGIVNTAAEPNIPGCMRSGISTRPGASTGGSTAGWNSPSRSYKPGSGTRPSR